MNRSISIPKFFYSNLYRRYQSAKRKRAQALPRRQKFLLEPLENRLLLSVSLVGIPDWSEQGPGPIENGNNVILPAQNSPQVGAVHAIAVDTTNANRVFVATTNGGIWRSDNATFSRFDGVNNDGDGATDEADENPTWVSVTDQLPTLSLGSLSLSPLDPARNTLFAGAGRFSNGFADGGPLLGMFRSTDGGAIWATIGGNTFNGVTIERILATGLGGALASQPVLAATSNGVYRSTDGGGIWTLLSGSSGVGDMLDNDADGATDEAGELNLPGGYSTDVVPDPGNVNRFYAGINGQGVFRSDDGGATWRAVNNGITGIGGESRIELSVSATAGNPVYVGLVSGAGVLNNVFRSANQGGNWAVLGAVPNTNPGGQGGFNFSIVADPNNNNIVFVAGDRGTVNNAGNIFRGDSNTNTWVSIANAGASNTAPHPDSRDMVFSFIPDGMGGTVPTILEGDDGGLYRLRQPNGPAPVWDSVLGNMRPTEFWSVGYDEFNDRIFGGTQDNGNPNQSATGSFLWQDPVGGDGGIVAVEARDNDNNGSLDESNRYMETQNINTFRRIQFTTANPAGVASNPALQVIGTGGRALNGAGTQPFGTPPALVFDNSRQFVQPFVLNAVAPNQLLFGTRFLYESLDQGGTVTSLGGLTDLRTNGIDEDGDGSPANDPNEWAPAGPVGAVRAMAYGGRLNGAPNAAVIYVGTNGGTVNGVAGTLFLRTANTTNSLADFTTLNNYPGAAPNDIVLDPDNWQRGYVVDNNGRVFRFVNGGAALADWTNITGNLGNFLAPLQTADPSVPSLLRTVELYTPTAAAGDDVVLVGGQGGVFRTLDPQDGANAVWTEFGAGLPNGLVSDLRYSGRSDVLLVGTRGRGAWEVTNASNTLTVTGVLQIFGDDNFFGEDDTIVLVRDPNNPSLLNVFDDGDFSQFQLSTIQQIDFFGFAGNDMLTVDSTNGLINVVNGIRYDGDGGVDQLQLLQTGGPTHTSDTYSVGPAIGSGISTIVGAGMGNTQTVFFEELSPVLDLVPAALLTVNATEANNALNYMVGSLVTNGLVTIDAHEPIEFSNKTAVVINAGAGTDTLGVNNAFTPTGLTGITVSGGDPTSGDTLIVTGVGVAVAVNTAISTITGATGAGGAVGITYGTIEALNLVAGIGALTLTTTGADDAAVVTPGVTPAGSNSGTLQSNGVAPDITFANSGTVTLNLGGGTDAVVVNGSSLGDTVAVSDAAVVITGRHAVNYTGVQAVTVNGQAGSDTFNVTPSATVAMFIDGGDPVGPTPGDLLNITAGGGSVTYNAGPETDEGSFVVGANQPVSFDHIESFGITGSGPVVINGSNGPDAITVIARDSSTHAAANGVQDFTVSVNTGPALLFIDVASLTVNAFSGSDQVTLQAPAPNNAVWAVDVTVNGGAPAADTDRLIVQTPGAAAEAVSYTPTAFDGGTLNLTSLSSLITITTTEALSYDGQGDNDTLTVVGTGGNDTIVHSPGANDEAGSFQVNSLLALSYQNLGAGASLTANGAGGADTLVYHGTAANDSFTIGALGQVTLNSRPVVNTAGIETLTLEGLEGDDVFTLLPAIAASVYPTINLNGGAQASAGGDRANLSGTGGDDTISISGQVVSVPGVTVQASGVEAIRLDALGGNDLLTYNGVVGVLETITVSSSGVVGGGQVSVPGVTLIDFSGVERVDVHGNTPTPTETDTLTFAGTNAVDVFQINLAAAGSDADPILKLQDAAGAATLLTLRNYTNFNTLRVQGLDGVDTFNVFTGPSGPSRNLFVDGGLPSGKKKSTDNLNVFYTPPRPRIIHSAATQDPDAGLVDLDYGSARYLVQYDDIEQVVIARS